MILSKAQDRLAPYSTFVSNIDFDDVVVLVHKNVSGKLILIHKFITLRSPPRIIALVGNAHVSTLKLLRDMGVVFIVSLRDSFLNIRWCAVFNADGNEKYPGFTSRNITLEDS